MATPKILSIEDITNMIIVTDNFLNDLQDDGATIDPKELVQRRRELDAILKFFNAEG